jgi:hypothetical protein
MVLKNIRELFGMTPNDISKEFMNGNGNNLPMTGTYYGKVIDIDDPKHQGRIKVLINGKYSKFQKKDIPWAYPESNFIGSLTGSMIIPPLNSLVSIRFQNGDIHLPVYKCTKLHCKNSLPSGKSGLTDPKNLIFWETNDNDYFEINQTEKEMTLHHSSGTTISINKLGHVTIHATQIIDKSKGSVTPTGYGPFCALPIDPYTGMFHTGNVVTAVIPVV